MSDDDWFDQIRDEIEAELAAYVPFLVEPGWVDSAFIPNVRGDSYRLLFYADGTVRFEHKCDRGDRGLVVCAPALAPEHQVDRATVTVSPSILCADCGTHGFVRDGSWVAA